MSRDLTYVSRITRLPVVGPDGTDLGRVADVVLGAGSQPPMVNGFVAAVGRRRVFVGAGRVAEITAEGVRLRRGSINMRSFATRPGEKLVVGEMFGQRVARGRVADVGLRAEAEPSTWVVETVAFGARRVPGLRRAPTVADWKEAGELFSGDRPDERQAATLGNLHPSEAASELRKLPAARRAVVAAALGDDRLADLLEELDEAEQVALIAGLDLERLGSVLDEMEADDAADLLAEIPLARRSAMLAAMTPEDAAAVRRLLAYDSDTAGGLMTPEPLVVGPQTTVAEALAQVREYDVPMPLAAQVYVCHPPLETPTGRYLGAVGFQRLLREPPGRVLARCIDEEVEPVAPDAPGARVAERLAAYDTVALPVCDAADRLVGAVTVDDVLDHTLPDDWRLTHEAG